MEKRNRIKIVVYNVTEVKSLLLTKKRDVVRCGFFKRHCTYDGEFIIDFSENISIDWRKTIQAYTISEWGGICNKYMLLVIFLQEKKIYVIGEGGIF